MKKAIITGLILLVLVGVAFAATFKTEAEAITWRDANTIVPTIVVDAEIFNIHSRIGDSRVMVEWKLITDIIVDEENDAVYGLFTITKDQEGNQTLIQEKLEADVIRRMGEYRSQFVPNPMIQYSDNPSFGKTFQIDLGWGDPVKQGLLDTIALVNALDEPTRTAMETDNFDQCRIGGTYGVWSVDEDPLLWQCDITGEYGICHRTTTTRCYLYDPVALVPNKE
ncbi:MAG: hypothetical protein CL811_06335 [Colwelliaceae bacterium]|jgi:hypothetical protein|nr:hypothetical protein [Colwelliaceae bacterium]|tara:strand:- start:3801 stop:4472 length:672 start_codon:yes stop_codon:yes gene_type:complete